MSALAIGVPIWLGALPLDACAVFIAGAGPFWHLATTEAVLDALAPLG